MGQKSNPIGLRLGINRAWDSVWYDERNFADRIKEDLVIRNYILTKYSTASISKVEINRTSEKAIVNINTARPGLIIGKGGSEVDLLKKGLNKLVGYEVQVNVSEIKRPALVAKLVGQNIAQQLEKKVNYRRAVKKSIQSTMQLGAAGIRVCISGRLNGAEIARSETFREGRVPLHTLRSNIDYAIVEANTTYGIIGLKVWIFNDKV
ncbi:MAG: 30S ribosomal protein S3 [Candidatus Marinimicrobia bacterium]|nr:30S ribosomal protein S3 [Candidatus Neomarinimicrobiota bacterium]